MTRPHHVTVVCVTGAASALAGFYLGTLLGWCAWWGRRLI